MARLVRRGRIAGLSAAALVAAGAAVAVRERVQAAPRTDFSREPSIVLPAPSAVRWVALLRSAGASVRIGTVADAVRRSGFVAPAGAALTAGERKLLAEHVRDGGNAVVADDDLLEAIGFDRRPATHVDSVFEQGRTDIVFWPASLTFAPVEETGKLARFTRLAWNHDSVVEARAAAGHGDVLALAIDPFGRGRQGHELFPALAATAARLLDAAPGPRRNAVEVYFDPSASTLPPEEVAKRAAAAGAQTVQIGGWSYGFLDRPDYAYRPLIDAIHARGMRAYAWLEPPLVNTSVWDGHPDCREKTQSGADAKVDWRSLIALEDGRCFDIAWSVWSRLLRGFDWDGVNIAELYFETGSRERFTPFHPSALAAFGGNPEQQPNRFLDWRTGEVTRLNRKLAERVRALRPALAIQLTVIDDELDPELGRKVGSDVKALAGVARSVGGTLQVEDPFTTWADGPARYTKLVPKLAPLMPDHRVFVDVNVVPRYGARPTAQATGGELSLTVTNAARASGRVAIYSLATLTAADAASLPGALAGAARVGDGFVSAPWTVVVSTPDPERSRLFVDGKPWPSARGRAIVPAGRHTLDWRAGRDTSPALLSLTAELESQSAKGSSLAFAYSADASAWAVVARRPASLRVDGRTAPLRVLAHPAGGFTVRLPRGEHRAVLSFGP